MASRSNAGMEPDPAISTALIDTMWATSEEQHAFHTFVKLHDKLNGSLWTIVQQEKERGRQMQARALERLADVTPGTQESDSGCSFIIYPPELSVHTEVRD